MQGENIYDRYKEWERIDSAGYSLPNTGSTIDSVIDGRLFSTPADGLELYTHVAATQTLLNTRAKSWINAKGSIPLDKGIWHYNIGARMQWAQLSNEVRISPRARFNFIPDGGLLAAYRWTFAAGLYDQYPFYREMRLKDGTLNTDVKSQQALHLIVRQDKDFELWNRPFVWTLETYYKGLQRVNLFDVENVRIRYQGNNDGLARVYGIDSRINGEFVKAPTVGSLLVCSALRSAVQQAWHRGGTHDRRTLGSISPCTSKITCRTTPQHGCHLHLCWAVDFLLDRTVLATK